MAFDFLSRFTLPDFQPGSVLTDFEIPEIDDAFEFEIVEIITPEVNIEPGGSFANLDVSSFATFGSAGASGSASASGPGSSSVSVSAFASVGADGSSYSSVTASASTPDFSITESDFSSFWL